MSIRAVLCAVACALALPAFASEPGQPLDCSDWVFVDPGLSCSVFVPRDEFRASELLLRQGTNKVIDNSGVVYWLRMLFPDGYSGLARLELVRYAPGQGVVVVAYIADRDTPLGRNSIRPTNADCTGSGSSCRQPSYDGISMASVITFDATHGRMLIPLRSEDSATQYDTGWWIAAIQGFATTFDVLQTYTPQSTVGFRVPYMPEGMAGADKFDTYWGPLTKPIDFTQAHPLACDYPATAPHVGDYLTVNDTLPTPAPGSGYYYVTAATYQGQTRYGRKTTAGHLSGRDPALLPACE